MNLKPLTWGLSSLPMMTPEHFKSFLCYWNSSLPLLAHTTCCWAEADWILDLLIIYPLEELGNSHCRKSLCKAPPSLVFPLMLIPCSQDEPLQVKSCLVTTEVTLPWISAPKQFLLQQLLGVSALFLPHPLCSAPSFVGCRWRCGSGWDPCSFWQPQPKSARPAVEIAGSQC